MDRRPDPTDELYDFAREAYACADYEQAVYFLRKASSLAPMRQDIRQFLAEVLSRSGETSADRSPVGGPSPTDDLCHSPIEIVQAPIPQEQLPARAEARASTTAASFFQLPLRRLMERLPVRPLFGTPSENDGDDKDEETVPPPVTARIEPIKVAEPSIIDACPVPPEPEPSLDSFDPLPGDDVVRMSLARPSPRSEFASSRRGREKHPDSGGPETLSRPTAPTDSARLPDWDSAAEDETPAPVPAAKRERARRLRPVSSPEPGTESASAATEEPAEESASEAPTPERVTAADWLASLPAPSRRTVVFSCAYSAVAVFVIVASTQCYRKFFREPQPSAPNPVTATAAPTPSPTQAAASVGVPGAIQSPRDDTADRIRSLLREGQLDKAAVLFRSHAERLGNDGNALRMELANAYDRKGTEHLTHSRFGPAIEHYSKALAIASTHAGLAVHLGNAHYHAARDAARKSKKSAAWEELQKAKEVLLRALELDSQSIEAYHRLATVYQQLGDESEAHSCWTKALAVLKQSLQTDGQSVETYQRIAMVAGCLGRTSEQREAFQAILKLAKPGSPAALSAQKELRSLEKTR